MKLPREIVDSRRTKSLISKPIYKTGVLIIIFAAFAPLGWMAILAFLLEADPLRDLLNQPYLYLYMFLGTAVIFSIFRAYVSRKERRTATLALHDPLTGLYNVRYFYFRLSEEYANVGRTRSPLSLLIIDLDYFKKINDTYGHPAGDEVLKAIANSISRSRRVNETVARVGGEEFVLLLPNCPLVKAVQVAERVRNTIKEERIVLSDGIELKVTASIGVATTEDFTPGGEKKLYSCADSALYRAKRNGRDLTVANS